MACSKVFKYPVTNLLHYQKYKQIIYKCTCMLFIYFIIGWTNYLHHHFSDYLNFLNMKNVKNQIANKINIFSNLLLCRWCSI